MISNLFKTRYRIDLYDNGCLWVSYRKWYSLKWNEVDWAIDMDGAMKVIADHKKPPAKPVTVYEE